MNCHLSRNPAPLRERHAICPSVTFPSHASEHEAVREIAAALIGEVRANDGLTFRSKL